MQFKKDDRIIIKGNEPEGYNVGLFIEYTTMDNCKDRIPLVILDKDAAPIQTFGIVIPYTEEMETRLDKLTPEQQYILLWTMFDWDTDKQLILIRGLPGSGKSTTAKTLAGNLGQVFSTDDFFCLNDEREYRFDGNKLHQAHKWNQRRSLDAMKAGIPIVVIDNTNTTIRELRSYLQHIELARQLGYSVSIVEPETSWRFDIKDLVELNSHGVPEAAIQRMLNRYVKDVKLEDVIFKK